jgi:hypothetical protein
LSEVWRRRVVVPESDGVVTESGGVPAPSIIEGTDIQAGMSDPALARRDRRNHAAILDRQEHIAEVFCRTVQLEKVFFDDAYAET